MTERGKTASPTQSAREGPDPLQGAWGDWLVQNSKGRVRTIGGLERNALCAISPVEPVGARSPEAVLDELDPDEICKVTGRSREIRDLMSKHIAVGTVRPNFE